jgi:hypothetical protein
MMDLKMRDGGEMKGIEMMDLMIHGMVAKTCGGRSQGSQRERERDELGGKATKLS